MKARTKLREEKLALREVKEKVEALLREREYTQVVEEIAAFSQGYTPGERDVEWAELQLRLVFAKEELGSYDKETAQDAYDVLKPTNRHKEIGTIQWVLGKIYLALGETETALRYLRNSLSVFDTTEDEKRKLETLNTLSQACFLNSRTGEAIEHLTEALNLCRKRAIKGNRSQEAMILGNLGTVYRRVGQWSLASKMLRSSLKLYEELNDTLEIARGLTALARLLILQRRWDDKVSELLDRAQKIAGEGGYQRERATVYESLGWMEIGLFQKDGSSQHLELAEQWLLKGLQIGQRVAPQGDVVCEVSQKLGWVCLMLDRLDAALGYGNRGLRFARSQGSAYDEGLAHRLLGAVYQAKDERGKAERAFPRSITLLEEADAQYDLALSLFYSGKLLVEDLETRSEGFEQLTQGRKTFHSLKLNYWEGESWIEEAKGRIKERDFDKVSKCLIKAKEVLKGSGEEEALREVIRVRAELNKTLAQTSLSVKEEINLLVNQSSSKSLDELLGMVTKKTSAERAIAGVRGSAGGLELRAYRGIDEVKARDLLERMRSLDGLKPRMPFFSSSVPDDLRLTPLKQEGVSSVMMVPLGMDEEVDGLLYVDRLSNKPFQQKDLNFFVLSAGILQLKVTELQKEELIKEVKSLKEKLREGEIIITRNEKMREVLDLIQSLKGISPSVLIEGESGTGKELIARLIYRYSPRRDKPFIPINCASIPDNLLENELFGHEKGAYTDAKTQHRGLLESADGGTLFLDEIADLSLALQPKILRFLEEETFRRVGGTEEIKVDVRVIAATNKDLRQQMEAGRLREDLFYRLNRLVIKLPPLREREEDIPLLAQYYLEYYCRKYKKEIKGVSPEALSLLLAYSWPGNIRELMTVVEKGVILARGSLITPELLPEEIKGQDFQQSLGARMSLKELEKKAIQEAIKKAKGSKYKASELLGIGKSTLYRKVKEYGLN